MRHLGGWGRREHAPDEVGAPDGAAAEAVDGLPHRLERRRRVDLRSAADRARPDGGRSRRAFHLGAHGRQLNAGNWVAECEDPDQSVRGGGLRGQAARVRSRGAIRREKRLCLYKLSPGEGDVERSNKEPLAVHGASNTVFGM
jgi:hypothetical protein